MAGTSNYRNLQQSFCYDGLNRLIKTANAAYSSSYCASITSADQDQRYDAFGNITWKTGIGGYTYGDAAKPQTLTSTSGGSVMDATNYTYDKTGNMTSDTSGRALTYSVFDKPTLITKGTDSVSFAYGPDRNYYKRTDVKAGITTRTHHIGGVEKVIKSDNSYEVKRYIAGVAIWTHKFNSSGAQTLLDKQYTYKDVLGSTVLITDAVGGIKGQMAFDEWGKRVSYNDWRTDQSATYGALQVATLFTTQGYTGHDMLDAVGLIHMQGRIYDARLGRFVQADPIVQDATDLQAYNRYAYVRNNPLTLVDPSGFSWFSKTWKKVWKNPILKLVIVAVASYFTAGWAAGWATSAGLGSVAAGAVGGFAGGFVAGGLTTGTLEGAFLGGVPGAAFGGFGAYAKINGLALGTRSLAHGMIGGTMSVLQGGKFGHGFISAGLTKYANISDGPLGGIEGVGGVVARTAAAAAVGGTVSELTGGKFANGAETAAYGQLFNGESKFWNKSLNWVNGKIEDAQASLERSRENIGKAIFNMNPKVDSDLEKKLIDHYFSGEGDYRMTKTQWQKYSDALREGDSSYYDQGVGSVPVVAPVNGAIDSYDFKPFYAPWRSPTNNAMNMGANMLGPIFGGKDFWIYAPAN